MAKAPTHMAILLWHHFRYYRNKSHKLVFIFLIPLLTLLAIFYATLSFTNGNFLRLLNREKEQFTTETSLGSSGPLEVFLNEICSNLKPPMVSGDLSSLHQILLGSPWSNDSFLKMCNSDPRYQVEPVDLRKQILDVNMRTNHADPVTDCDVCSNGFSLFTSQKFQKDQYDLLCTVLTRDILYYPKTPAISQKIVSELENKLNDYVTFFNNAPNSYSVVKGDENYELNLLLSIINRFKHCAVKPVKDRIIGFDTLKQIEGYVSNTTNETSETRFAIPRAAEQFNFWGVVSFNEFNMENSVQLRLVYDKSQNLISDDYNNKNRNRRLRALQQIVEASIIATQDSNNDTKVSWVTKKLPSRCVTYIDPIIYPILFILVPLGAVTSFLMIPALFLEQVLTEKSLRLREYLYIMGVGPLKLKLSWILFYLFFTVPVVIMFVLALYFLPGPVFRRSDPTLIFVILLLYSVSLLSFCCFLASILQGPKRTAILITFLNTFFWILTTFCFQTPKIIGAKLTLARVISFYPVAPLVISFSYVTTWEKRWEGARWNNVAYSPIAGDEFGGISTCMIWLLVDTLIYFIAGWYIENIMPGEFGIRKPPWFCLLPSYFCPCGPKGHAFAREEQSDGDGEIGAAEKEPAGIVLKNFSKHYHSNNVAVNRLSLEFYHNQITSFLGQNGAGKSTTMNALVGLLTPSSGEARVMDMDISTKMIEIRKVIGFVPQYDILYPNLTVTEHLQFFGWLKKLSSKRIRHTTEPLLNTLGMQDNKNTCCTKLSGGQKRKLSVITAYLGDPKVLILDEPTSGVDPYSRRAIWDLILSRKTGTTTLISTHNMQEADLLSDRIAIISNGKLCCTGSPMHLKNKYGRGYRLIIASDHQSRKRQGIKRLVKERVFGSNLDRETRDDISFSIPVEYTRSPDMVLFLEDLEQNKRNLGIFSYGLSEPSIEEVFFAATDVKDDLNEANEMEAVDPGNLNGTFTATIEYQRQTSSVRFFNQGVALFKKKCIYMALSLSGYLLQILLPLAFILLLLVIVNQISPDGCKFYPAHIWESYRENVLFVQDKRKQPNQGSITTIGTFVALGLGPRCPNSLNQFDCQPADTSSTAAVDNFLSSNLDKVYFNATQCPCRSGTMNVEYCTDDRAIGLPNIMLRSGDRMYNIGPHNNATEWVLKANRSLQHVIGGFQFHELPQKRWNDFVDTLNSIPGVNSGWINVIQKTNVEYVTVWTKSELQMGMSNVWANAILKQNGGAERKIQLYLAEATLSDSTEKKLTDQMTGYIQLILSSLFISLCFGFGTFGIAIFVQYEKTTGLKRLQLLFGTNPIIYWVSNILADTLLFMVTTAIVLVVLYFFENSFQEDLMALLIVAISYGWLAISFTYVLSFIFKGTTGIVILTVLSFIIFIIAANIMLGLEVSGKICEVYREIPETSDSVCHTFPLARAFARFLNIFPSYYICDCIGLIALTRVFKLLRETSPGGVNIPHYKVFEDIYAYDNLGQRLVIAFVVGGLYFSLTFLFEYFDLRTIWPIFKKLLLKCSIKNAVHSETIVMNPFQIHDKDVATEAQRVNQCANLEEEPLMVKQVSKIFPQMKMPAVSKVSFGVPKSQCFGLLGINGAGKTMLFKILTGSARPSAGKAYLAQHDLFNWQSGWGRLEGSSYCPQENTLFDNLTASQHLNLFASIRGIPHESKERVVKHLLEEVGLTLHISKRASQLSGGNRRKLQFALALLDYSPVIFLDEPTTGMDPGARRKAWACVERAIDKGSSVILTSHSMEECEQLCHRLAIMVAGSFQCIGSVQYLKDKFGNKYTFKIRLRKDKTSDSSSQLVIQNGYNGVNEDSPTVETTYKKWTNTKSSTEQMRMIKGFVHQSFPEASVTEEHKNEVHFEASAVGLRLPDLFKMLNQCRERFAVDEFSVSQITLEHVFVNMAKVQGMLQSGIQIDLSQVASSMAGNSTGQREVLGKIGAQPAMEMKLTGGHGGTMNIQVPSKRNHRRPPRNLTPLPGTSSHSRSFNAISSL